MGGFVRNSGVLDLEDSGVDLFSSRLWSSREIPRDSLGVSRPTMVDGAMRSLVS